MRLSVPQVGVLFVLLSLTFFFGALILAFGARIGAGLPWQPFTVPPILWTGTILLAGSSFTLEAARFQLRRALLPLYRLTLGITLGLATGFLVIQCLAAADLLRQGVAAAGNPRGSAFYVFMTIHGLHLIVGMGLLFHLWLRSRVLAPDEEGDLRRNRRRLSAASLFWHFMGVLWLVMFFFLKRWAAEA